MLGTTTNVVNPILTAALLVVPPIFGGITYRFARRRAHAGTGERVAADGGSVGDEPDNTEPEGDG